MLLKNNYYLKCKSCGYEWKEETINPQSIFYCPECGMIGHLSEQFKLIQVETQ